MADLSDNQSALVTKIIGAESNGLENNFISSVGDRLKTENKFTYENRQDFSGTQATSSNSGTLDSEGFGCISSTINVTAASGTTPTLDIQMEVSDDGSNWRQVYTVERIITTGVKFIKAARQTARYYRLVWTIAGTTPSFTFSIQTTLKQMLPPKVLQQVQYSGLNLASNGATSVPINIEGLSSIGIITVRAADGGNGGSFRVDGSNDSINWVELTGNIGQNANTVISTPIPAIDGPFRLLRLRTSAATNVGTRVLDIQWAGVE